MKKTFGNIVIKEENQIFQILSSIIIIILEYRKYQEDILDYNQLSETVWL